MRKGVRSKDKPVREIKKSERNEGKKKGAVFRVPVGMSVG